MLYLSCGNIVQLTLWSLWLFLKSESPLFWAQCHSESSRSEDISSDGEEDESPSLSPSSSHSCSKVGHSAPPSDSPAPCSLQIEGANFLSATPAQWSVEEVCRFISSLQGWCSLISFVSLNHVSSSLLVLIYLPVFCSGCEELAAQFLSQEIDGQALLLLREDHLISTMNIKLGPALKICASINTLREWCSLQRDRRIILLLLSPHWNQYLDLLLF